MDSAAGGVPDCPSGVCGVSTISFPMPKPLIGIVEMISVPTIGLNEHFSGIAVISQSLIM